jgi:hypothetical protein
VITPEESYELKPRELREKYDKKQTDISAERED